MRYDIWVSLGMMFLLCFLWPPGSWSQTASIQEKGTIVGIVLESGSSKRIAAANIANKTQNTRTTSNQKGEFSLLVSVGDTLVFSSMGYQAVQTVIHTLSDILIDLRPSSIMMDAVTINRQSKEAELQDVMESYSRHGIYQGGKPSVMSYIFMPLTSLYERFSKKGKQARNFRNFMENELEATHIDRVFTSFRVTRLTGLEGEDLDNFMLLYRPAFEDARYWGEYDVTKYIKDSYNKFVADGKADAVRLPRINADTKF